MAINNTDRLCHSTSIPFDVIYRKEIGEPVEPDFSLITRDGVVTKCDYGYNHLSGESDQWWHVLHSIWRPVIHPIFSRGWALHWWILYCTISINHKIVTLSLCIKKEDNELMIIIKQYYGNALKTDSATFGTNIARQLHKYLSFMIGRFLL